MNVVYNSKIQNYRGSHVFDTALLCLWDTPSLVMLKTLANFRLFYKLNVDVLLSVTMYVTRENKLLLLLLL